MFPRGPKGPGEPYASSLVRIPPPPRCLDPQGILMPLGNPTRNHLFVSPPYLDPQEPLGPRGAKHMFLVIVSPPPVSIPRGTQGPSALNTSFP